MPFLFALEPQTSQKYHFSCECSAKSGSSLMAPHYHVRNEVDILKETIKLLMTRPHVEFGCENALLPSLSRRSRVQVPAGANAFYFTGCQIK